MTARHLRLVRDEPIRGLRETVEALGDLRTFQGACVVCGLERAEHTLMRAIACGVAARERA